MGRCEAAAAVLDGHVKAERVSKICFDRFHVARAINEAVNNVRKEEHRALSAAGDPVLKGTKYVWVKNPDNHTDVQ